MAIEREAAWAGQMRVDVPHLRALDSGVRADFDVAVGASLAGGQALVIRGFTLSATVGAPATSAQLLVDPGLVWHPGASEAGTVFATKAGTAPEVLAGNNPHVLGSFVASRTNYVGIDLLRTADASTSDLVEFLDANTLEEDPETVPLARTLNYVIVISTTPFESQTNVLPLALVVVDAFGNVTSTQDARNFAFRLGTGGTVPNPLQAYAWPQGRNEAANADGFTGGDKAFTSLRDAVQGIESRLAELGGGPYWYSPTADRQVKLVRNLGSRFATGDNFYIVSANVIQWAGLAFAFCNATDKTGAVVYKAGINDGTATLAVGQCLYVDVSEQPATSTVGVSNTVATAQVSTMATLGLVAATPGCTRWVIAWRTSEGWFTRDSQFGVGTLWAPASNTANGLVELNTPAAAGNSATPFVVTADGELATAAGGNTANAVATGLTRGSTIAHAAPDTGAGALRLGFGVSDTSILIGQSAGNTGQTLSLGYGAGGGGTTTNLDGCVVNIGITNTAGAQTVNIGQAASASVVINAIAGSFTTTTGILNIDSTSGNVNLGTVTTGHVSLGLASPVVTLGNTVSACAITVQGKTSATIVGGTLGLGSTTTMVVAAGSTLALESIGATTLTTGGALIGIGHEAFADTINIGQATFSHLNLSGAVVSIITGAGTINVGDEAQADTISIGDHTLSAGGGGTVVNVYAKGGFALTAGGGTIAIGDESAADTITIGHSTGTTTALSLYATAATMHAPGVTGVATVTGDAVVGGTLIGSSAGSGTIVGNSTGTANIIGTTATLGGANAVVGGTSTTTLGVSGLPTALLGGLKLDVNVIGANTSPIQLTTTPGTPLTTTKAFQIVQASVTADCVFRFPPIASAPTGTTFVIINKSAIAQTVNTPVSGDITTPNSNPTAYEATLSIPIGSTAAFTFDGAHWNVWSFS